MADFITYESRFATFFEEQIGDVLVTVRLRLGRGQRWHTVKLDVGSGDLLGDVIIYHDEADDPDSIYLRQHRWHLQKEIVALEIQRDRRRITH
jgi:hypothetical protein